VTLPLTRTASEPVRTTAAAGAKVVNVIGTGRRWWGDRSATERFDLSTRLSLYLVLGAPLLITVSQLSEPDEGQRVRPAVAAVLLVAVTLHPLACGILVNRALDRQLGRPAALRRPLTAAVLLTVVGVAAGATALDPAGGSGDLAFGGVVAICLTGLVVAALSPLVPAGGLAALVAAAAVVAAGIGALLGGGATATNAAILTGLWLGFMTGTYKFSAWYLGVVWELDRGRATAARLAVAEERLRFARDLHDVLGRNLSVIAVKSELAGRLAERGDPGAAAEMAEVRRVAHDSLREVRDVVRGYRTADLGTELAGARSVLRSAGVECRVIGDGAGLPEAVQTALGWVVREATTNVIRHSDATTCTIGLDVRGGGGATTAVLRMENDRPRPAPPGAAGSGLAGLSERLAGLGGRLTAERHPDHGTGRPGERFVVEASVPVVAP
jgi:two-component system sensor histidine kinase DesK